MFTSDDAAVVLVLPRFYFSLQHAQQPRRKACHGDFAGGPVIQPGCRLPTARMLEGPAHLFW